VTVHQLKRKQTPLSDLKHHRVDNNVVFATHNCALCVVLYLAVKSLDHTPKYIDDTLATISTINSIKNMHIHNKTHKKVRTKVTLLKFTAVAGATHAQTFKK